MTALLEGHALVKNFGPLQALRGIDLQVFHGETLALVGESGCGKTTLARALTLLDPADAGSVSFDGHHLQGLGRRALKPFRRRMQMVFQDPYESLNPRLSVAASVAEPLAIHGVGNRRTRRQRVAELLEQVGLRSGDLARYPHQFSGGQRQRIAIARALALEPELIVADEPVSALDVSIQSQILNLMQDLQQRFGLAYLFVGHDLEVVRHIADRVAVMYLGRIVEHAPAATLFADPRHPYTQALLRAAPKLGHGKRMPGKAPQGDVPSPLAPPPGCAFHPRCPLAADDCRRIDPRLEPIAGTPDHTAACHYREQAKGQLDIEVRP